MTIDDLGVEVHLFKEGVVLSLDSRSSEKFVHGIRVLMAKNYIDNLSEEVRKGMREKAEQGHWPAVAHLGYRNNTTTRRMEIDPERGPLVAKRFEWYARGDVSQKEVTRRAFSVGLTHNRSRSGPRRMTKSEVHRLLRNPIYVGDFMWNGRLYRIGRIRSSRRDCSKCYFRTARSIAEVFLLLTLRADAKITSHSW